MNKLKRILIPIYSCWKDDSFKKFSQYNNNFGLKIALQLVLAKKITILSDYKWNLTEKIVYKYCENFANSVIESYKDNINIKKEEDKIPVWVMWWQGLDEAPEVIKVCIQSQKKAFSNDKYNYHIITKENLYDFISVSDMIQQKLDGKEITFTHFSDIVRMKLLNEYGGIWLDSTLFFAKKIEPEIYNYDFYTNKKYSYPHIMRQTVPKGKWTGYFMRGEPRDVLFGFMCDVFEKYWNEHNMLIDYYLIDYMILVAYNNLIQVTKAIDAVPENNSQIFYLVKVMNQKYSESEYANVIEDTQVFKLDWRKEYKTVDEEGAETYWGYIKKQYEN